MRALLAAFLLALPAQLSAQETRLFTLGAGDVSGSYYAAASAICDVVNRTEERDLRCSPDPTSGSIYNLDALRRGQIDFALVQSDLQRKAYEGTGSYARQGPMQDMRSVMSLYGETLSILVAPEVKAERLSDLRDTRLDVGLPASGRRATVDLVLATLGYKPVDFATLAEMPAGVAIDSLCTGALDATILVVGHPNAAIARAMDQCGARLIGLSAAETAAITARSPEIRESIVPMISYPSLTRDVDSVAVTATVVTRAQTPPELVTALVADTLRNLPLLARRAPVLSGLDAAAMRVRGLTAPLHPGAEAAFEQVPAP